MNYYIKSFLASAFTTTLFTSCDSGPDNEPFDSDSIAQSLDSPIPGDIITWNPITGSDLTPFDEVLEGLVSTVGTTSYTYSKTGDHTFSIDVVREAETPLQSTLADILGNGSPLGVELRDLLLDTEQDGDDEFESPDLVRIIAILNTFGNDINISAEDPTVLLTPTALTYSHRVLSTEGEQIDGAMGGLYTVASTGLVVGFREPTPAEANAFRFFDNSVAEYWVPFVTTLNFSEDVTETGTFTLNLVNFQ